MEASLKKTFLFLILIFLTFQVQAGWKSKVAIAGFSEQYIARTMITAVYDGKNIERAISIAKQVSKSSFGRQYLYNLLSDNLITEPYGFAATNAKTIIAGANLDTRDFNKKLSYEKSYYDSHVTRLTNLARGLKTNKRYQCMNRLQIYDKDAYIPIHNYSYPVKEWHFGSFKELASVDKISDDLEHDHIPSIAAILSYLQKRDGGKLLTRSDKSYGQIVHDNATSLEVTKKNHRAGRTSGRKNSPAQIQLDSLDLSLATIKDLAIHFKTKKTLTPQMIQSFIDVYARNQYLCLYI